MSRAGWHYPRKGFAETVYGLLATGPQQAIAMFGPRRTGKTEFLRQDLAPLVESKHHRAVYVSFWQLPNAPVAALLYELDHALRTGSIRDRIAAAAVALAPKAKLQAPGGVGEIEIDLSALKGPTPGEHLLLLDRYLDRFANDAKPSFLLFDEFQELAKAPDAQNLLAALRTGLDKRKNGLAAVFTGSSREGLRQVFSAKQAPFFRFATPLTLPTLGDDFVVHQLQALRRTSKNDVALDVAKEVFDRFDHNPLFFQKWLTKIALIPAISPEDAVASVQADLAEEFGYDSIWAACDRAKRITARLLAESVDRIYGEEADAAIAALGAPDRPSNSAIQAALRWFRARGLVDRWEEGWRLGDPLFAGWVRSRPLNEFAA